MAYTMAPSRNVAARSTRLTTKDDVLLAASELPQAVKERFEQNLQESRLLRLPAELRVMIYEYVIGGHHIQIEHKPPRMYKGYRARLWYFDCPRGLGLELDRDNGGFEWPRIAAWRYSHNFSYNESDKGVTMSLQKVCRQLRAETRLLVYKLNLFSFANSFVMRKWITSLKKAQALALTNICIPADYVFVKKHKDLLSGVTTFLDVEDPGERPVKVKKLTYEEFIDTYAS